MFWIRPTVVRCGASVFTLLLASSGSPSAGRFVLRTMNSCKDGPSFVTSNVFGPVPTAAAASAVLESSSVAAIPDACPVAGDVVHATAYLDGLAGPVVFVQADAAMM